MMIKAFENFINVAVEWTPENKNSGVFYKLEAYEKKWLNIYCDAGLIKKILKIDNQMYIWLEDDKVFNIELNILKSGEILFKDRHYWDIKSGLKDKYKSFNKNSISEIMDKIDNIMSLKSYMLLIDELNLEDITTDRQKKNGTIVFKSSLKHNTSFSRGEPNIKNNFYTVYARGVVTVTDSWRPKDLNSKRIVIKTWKDYDPLFVMIYNYEKYCIEKEKLKLLKPNITENMEEDEFKDEMNDSDDFIPYDILRNFSHEDQLTYAIESHPEHDFWIFVGRPGYKDVIVNGKKYKEEILEIETLCKIENVSDSKQANMMKMRAVSQGQNSKVYGVWLPKDIFDEGKKYIYGSEIPEFMLPLIDQHKKPV